MLRLPLWVLNFVLSSLIHSAVFAMWKTIQTCFDIEHTYDDTQVRVWMQSSTVDDNWLNLFAVEIVLLFVHLRIVARDFIRRVTWRNTRIHIQVRYENLSCDKKENSIIDISSRNLGVNRRKTIQVSNML